MSGTELISFIAERGGLEPADIDRARDVALRTGKSIEAAIIDLDMATTEAVYRAVADHAGVRYVSLKKVVVDPQIIEQIPARFVTHYEFMPVEERDGTLVVAVASPLDTHLIDELRLMLRRRIEPVVSTPGEITAATKQYYGIGHFFYFCSKIQLIFAKVEGKGNVIFFRRRNGDFCVEVVKMERGGFYLIKPTV